MTRVFQRRPQTHRFDEQRANHTSKKLMIRMSKAVQSLCEIALEIKFQENQPRIPAGNPGGGQWTDGATGTASELADDSGGSPVAANNNSDDLSAICEVQLERDIFQCRMVGLRSCYEQAYQRYASCLARQQIPPFNY